MVSWFKTEVKLPGSNKSRSYYEIRVEGALGDAWSDWFSGLEIRQETNCENCPVITVLYGLLPDQSALHGAIARIRDLNLNLISIQQVIEEGELYHESQ